MYLLPLACAGGTFTVYEDYEGTCVIVTMTEDLNKMTGFVSRPYGDGADDDDDEDDARLRCTL